MCDCKIAGLPYSGSDPQYIEYCPLHKAAGELLDWLKKESSHQNCVCKLNPIVGSPVPCDTCQLRSLIAKASHIKAEVKRGHSNS